MMSITEKEKEGSDKELSEGVTTYRYLVAKILWIRRRKLRKQLKMKMKN